ISATNSPRRTVRSTLSRATTLTWPRSNSLVRLVACTTVSLTWAPLAFGIRHYHFCAILERFRRADDQIFAADETLADFDFAPAGIFDNRNGSLDGFAIFHDEDRAIAHSAGGHANVGAFGRGGRRGALGGGDFARREEGDGGIHVRLEQLVGVEHFHAHLDRRFLTIGLGRDQVNDSGIFFVGVGIGDDPARLFWRDLGKIVLADVELDSQVIEIGDGNHVSLGAALADEAGGDELAHLDVAGQNGGRD